VRRLRFRIEAPSRQLLGLDLGGSQIKAVLLTRERGQIRLKLAAVTPTPPEALTAGRITNGLLVAETIRSLCRDRHLRARKVAVAVCGDKVYSQFEQLPAGFHQEPRDLIEDAMMKVIPYAIGDAAFDYQHVVDQQGQGAGLLWVSTTVEQVEWLRETVTLAGKTPAVIDVQACALANAYSVNYRPAPSDTVILLHVGLRQMTVALVRGDVLLFSRDALLREHAAADNGALDELILAELDRRWAPLGKRAGRIAPQRIYVSGGGCLSPQLRESLHNETGLPVEELNPFRSISFSPSSDNGRAVEQQASTLAIAVGLALRSFEGL
jgi:type IV pilus assembly protein PilM